VRVAGLRPQANAFRTVLDLSGLWEFRLDPGDEGRAAGWAEGIPGSRPIAVPGSWNEQLPGARDELGLAWYETSFELPRCWPARTLVRFGSANYQAEVFLNGQLLGEHEGGHLPFSFELGPALEPGRNRLVVRVDRRLLPDRVPPGGIPSSSESGWERDSYPQTNYDFFPYGGLHRAVRLCGLPEGAIERIAVSTALDGGDAIVSAEIEHGEGELRLRLGELVSDGEEMRVAGARLWSPADPHLEPLVAELERGGEIVDRYLLPIGLRTVAVDGDWLLLNGEPVRLRGFGRHEDFPVTGRGVPTAVAVSDLGLLRWTGANSFRTAHYPQAEVALDLADRLGLLVVAESPAVGLFFHEPGLERRREVALRLVEELIERDRNRPSVIAWSVANEPASDQPGAARALGELLERARALDPSRPATFASNTPDDPALEHCDLIALNRYYGWYRLPGRIEEAAERLAADLDSVHELHRKPILITELGADAIPGTHAEPPEMWSEEYQAELIERLLDVAEERPFVCGTHVWTLCDFKTGQATHRPSGLNFKGVFTRDRRPKLAARKLRERWSS
jgi:beta-glucuronidase